MRLDKYLSQASGLSRSQARDAIKNGGVKVNDQLVKRVDHQLAADAVVTWGDELVSPGSARYFMLHKPPGYVSATRDSDHPVVLDLLDEYPRGLSVAGRLDKDTTGLVLISDDGAWVHAIISPRRDCEKVYQAELDAEIDDKMVTAFAHGMTLRNEDKPTLPAQLKVLSGRLVEVRIREGKYHQVKRMFAACGRKVLALHRTQIGSILLDPSLAPGGYRALTEEEVRSIEKG